MSNQFLKLRRSAVPGKIPTTSSLDFGEIALNTYDGLAFMKKSGNGLDEIIVIGNSTGSFTGSFTGYLYGTSSWAVNSDTSSYPFSTVGTTIYSTYPMAGMDLPMMGSFIVGEGAGMDAMNADDSIMIGMDAGMGSTDAYKSIFLGHEAASGSTYANESNFIGHMAGIMSPFAFQSNFIGYEAGHEADLAFRSNFLGYNAGFCCYSASYSTIIGYRAGYVAERETSPGRNNIIIGSNITLPLAYNNGINIGGLIFGSGSYSNLLLFDNAFSGSAGGKIGINEPDPEFSLDVAGDGRFQNGLTVTSSLIAPKITGSLYGTASWALNSISASFSITASYFSGSITNAIFAETASYAQTSSYAITASYFSGSISNAINAETASVALTASYITNIKGDQYYVAVYDTINSISTGSIYDSGSFTAIGSISPTDALNPERLFVDAGNTTSYNLISGHGEVDNYLQLNIQNFSYGATASSDIVATANDGTQNDNYIDMGINNSGYNAQDGIGGPNDAYLYSTGNDLLIGNASDGKKIVIFNGSGGALANARITVFNQGTVGINAANPNSTNPEALIVEPLPGLINDFNNLIVGRATVNENYVQLNIINKGSGSLASADVVATNDIGTETDYFIDMGVNSSGYNTPNAVGSANDAYLYSTGEHLYIGNASVGMPVMFFAGGLDAEANRKLLLDPGNFHQLTGSLNVSGSITAIKGFTGSLFGTSSWAINALTSSFVQNAATASSADNFIVRGNLTGSDALFTGTITAQRLNVQYITASTEFITGSTKFGTLSTDTHQFTGSVTISGSLSTVGPVTINNLTASIFGTSSWSVNSITASYVLNAVSSSFVSTASYVQLAQTASFVTIAQTASFVATASWSTNAITASYVQLAQTASFVTIAQTASFVATASWARNAVTASYVLNAISSSFASTASFVVLAQTASFVTTAQTASYVQLAQTASYITASNVYGPFGSNSVLTSSYALTASYALNGGGGGGISAVTIADEGIAQGPATFINFIGNAVTATVSANTASIFVAAAQGTGSVTVHTQASPAVTWSFNHQLNNLYPVLNVWDSGGFTVIPGGIKSVDANNIEIYFNAAQTGYASAVVGGTAQTASYAITASYALNGGGSSTPTFPYTGSAIISGSLIVTGSVYVSSSLYINSSSISLQQNLDVDTGTEVVATVDTGSYTAAFFDYYAKDGTNFRAGTVTSVWNKAGSVQYTDNSTLDIGNTSGVTMSVALNSGLAELRATVTSNNWDVKALVRTL